MLVQQLKERIVEGSSVLQQSENFYFETFPRPTMVGPIVDTGYKRISSN